MSARITLLAGLVCAFVMFGMLSFVSHETRAEGVGIYIAAGDSVAAGIGSSLPQARGYPAHVREWLQRSGSETIVLENVAIPGETASSFISGGQLDALVEVIDAAEMAGIPVVAISVTLGGNEMLGLQSQENVEREEGLSRFSGSYRTALNAIRSAAGTDVPLVVTTYYDVSAGDATIEQSDSWWISRFNESIQGSATEVGAVVADIESVFRGNVPAYTYVPFDVHPTNAGHMAIARAVAHAFQVTSPGPAIEVVSALEVSRQSPTLRFTVPGNFEVVSVAVSSSDVTIHGPFDVGDGQYAALLDLGDVSLPTLVVTITAMDVLGAVATVDVLISRTLERGAGT